MTPCWLSAAETKELTTDSFLDFVDGTLADGGVNTYVAADGTVRLINLWDLNRDGNFDLPVACAQDHDEEVPLFVYWADKNGFGASRRTELPTAGAIGAATADLNADGHVDIVVANRFDGERTNLDCFIYWGAEAGFSASRRTTLPARAAKAIAVGDLNGDRHPDIVVANCGVDYHMVVDNFQRSFVYWGSDEGFDADNRSELKTINCTDVTIAEVNRDGHPDILFANEGNTESESGVTIYFGDGKGDFTERRSQLLPGICSSGIEAADLDGDGFADLVLANAFRLNPKPDPPTGNSVQTYAVNSYIFWGAAEGYSPQRRTELPTLGARAAAVGDLNSDGLSDVVFANSAEGVSFVYWKQPERFLSPQAFPGAGAQRPRRGRCGPEPGQLS